jgi:DNA invertase Pin-like site-specific DNA recombinase
VEIGEIDAAPVRAAQYLRVSTDSQQHSLADQEAAIVDYAQRRGYVLVATYTDIGKSGLSLKGRDGLQQLLRAVLQPERSFDAILIFDVSRWGRFQDPDQAAHYEFVCRQAGLTIAYCAEPFENNLSPMSTIAKHLKRVMAGEYSRELSERLSRAHLQQAGLGFRQGGTIPFGFRRMLIDGFGRPKFLLLRNQRKGLQDDRVVTVPGPIVEQALIKKLFRWYVTDELTIKQIAARLHVRGITGTDDRPFSARMVRTVLRSEYCIGHYVYNRTTNKLQTKRRNNPEELWVRARAAEPIVSVQMFRKAQEMMAKRRGPRYSKKHMLRTLKCLLKQQGYLSIGIINNCPNTPHANSYRARFGSLEKVYALVGWKRPNWSPSGTNGIVWTDRMLLTELRRLHQAAGHLSNDTINRDTALPSADYIRRRFGSLAAAYRCCGFTAVTQSQIMAAAAARRRTRLATEPDGTCVRHPANTNAELIESLKRLLAQHGYLSAALINSDQQTASVSLFVRRFGSLSAAYKLARWSLSRRDIYQASAMRRCAAGLRQPVKSVPREPLQ